MLLCLSANIFAQQLPLYSNYAFNKYGFNPAYAGNKNRIESIFTYRQHMSGFPGAPSTQLLTASMPIQKYYLGTGIRILNDVIGISRITSFNGAVNYHIGFGPGRLTAGLELGLMQYYVDWEKIDWYEQDASVNNLSKSKVVFDAAFGLFYNTESWYVGYSIQNLFRPKVNFDEVDIEDDARLYMHHYINAGMSIGLNKNFNIEPHFLLKITRNAPWQLDVGSYVVFREMAGIGAAFRTGDAIFVTAKYDYKEMITVGYNYGIRVNSLSQYTANSHEIMLGYYYKLMEPARKKVIHPRYYF